MFLLVRREAQWCWVVIPAIARSWSEGWVSGGLLSGPFTNCTLSVCLAMVASPSDPRLVVLPGWCRSTEQRSKQILIQFYQHGRKGL